MKIIILFILGFIIENTAYSKQQEISKTCIVSVENIDIKNKKFDTIETKGILTSPMEGISGERLRFHLKYIPYDCELAFNGVNQGLFINCWKKDYSMGIKNDSSPQKGKDFSKLTYRLEIIDSNYAARIEAKCL